MLNLRAGSGHLKVVRGAFAGCPGRRGPLCAAVALPPRRGMGPGGSSSSTAGRTGMGGPAGRPPLPGRRWPPGKRLVPALGRRRRAVAAVLALLVAAGAAWFAAGPGSGAGIRGAPAGAGRGRAGWLARRRGRPAALAPGGAGQPGGGGGRTPGPAARRWRAGGRRRVGERGLRCAHRHRGGPPDRCARRCAARCGGRSVRGAGLDLRGRLAGHGRHGPGVPACWPGRRHAPRCRDQRGIIARAALGRRGGHHRQHHLPGGRL